MKKLFALMAAGFVVSSAPALAAGQTISFTSGTYTNPAWAHASVVQAFTTGQTSGSQVATGFTTSPAIGDAKSGTGLEISNAASPGMTGNFLKVAKGTGTSSSYTVNFNTVTGVQFVSFVLGNYKSNSFQSVIIDYITGPASANLLATAGLTGLTNNAAGLFTIDQGGGAGIKSITFSNTNGGGGNTLLIDDIAAAAPEPAAWLMMIFGFGLVGAQLRRRRPARPAAA